MQVKIDDERFYPMRPKSHPLSLAFRVLYPMVPVSIFVGIGWFWGLPEVWHLPQPEAKSDNKLWLVTYVGPKVSEVVGPLSSGMDECSDRASEMNEQWLKQMASEDEAGANGETDFEKTMSAKCIKAFFRPVVSYQPEDA
ncbi:hypothetical protein NKI20_32045 [Mesorhizobium sp. M0830]|uniref:hypothetical protein n=1 Tax=Mesorhizobium sp. M0830 TaxID=2957008 RepID=UPI0033367A84